MTLQPDRKLPPGWRWARLGEVIREAKLGFASGERDANGVAQLRMNNVTNRGQLDWSFLTRVPSAPEAIAAYRLEPGDVLFNNTNSTELVGKTALFEGHDEPVVFSNHFTRLRTIPETLLPAFLVLWLQSQWYDKLFENICNRWIGQSAVHREKLLSLEMPLPPLDQQRRTAALVKDQMAAAERARAAAEAQLEAAKALPAAHLRAIFTSPEAKGWPRKRLKELTSADDAFTDGPFGSNLKTEHYADEGARVVRLQNVGRGVFLDEDKAFISMDHFMTLQRHGVRTGDVIVAALGDGARPAGRACVIPEGFGPGLVKADCFRVRLPRENIIAPYLVAFLNSPDSISSIAEMMRGATRPRVTLGMLRDVVLPLPPLREQQRVVARLGDQMAAVEKMRKTLQEQLETMNKLPAALLRRAFSGEL